MDSKMSRHWPIVSIEPLSRGALRSQAADTGGGHVVPAQPVGNLAPVVYQYGCMVGAMGVTRGPRA